MIPTLNYSPLSSPFDDDPISMTEEELAGDRLQPEENGLVEEGDLGTAFDLSTTVTDPDTGIKAFQSTIREQDYGEAPVYTDADTALENYIDFYNRVQEQQEATSSVYNYNNYDPSDFARMGFAGPRAVSDRAGVDVVQDFLTENEIPLTQEIDGKTYYLTTGIGTPESYGARGDGRYVAQGPVGTYSTVFVEDPSNFEMVMSNPLVSTIVSALVTPMYTGAEATLSATQLATAAYDTIQQAEEEEPTVDNVIQTAIDIANQQGEQVFPTGFTPETPRPEEEVVIPELEPEPIEFELPAEEGQDASISDTEERVGDVLDFESTPASEGEFEYDPASFEDTFGDTWNEATFDTLDTNNDGVVTSQEMDTYERQQGQEGETEQPISIPSTITDGIADTVSVGEGIGEGVGEGEGIGEGEEGTKEKQQKELIQEFLDTRTTRGLFADELFRFETEIKDTQKRLFPLEINIIDLFDENPSGLEYITEEDNYEFMKPRSYSF
jgi:hypothetical protein